MTVDSALATDTLTADQMWIRCSDCGEIVFGPRFARSLRVCPGCGFHERLTAVDRIGQLMDPGSVTTIDAPPVPDDPLGFSDIVSYEKRLRAARTETGLDAAVLCVRGEVMGCSLIAAVMDFRFMGGSLDVAVGERITVAAEESLRTRTPFLVVTASGGARMQEGTFALMQMAKTSQALADLDTAGVLTLVLVTDPTYGGVAASFASLADIIVTEPGARMGFAGPRVIEQTLRCRLPDGFQTAEFLLRNGLVDDIRPRAELRPMLADLLRTVAGDLSNCAARRDRTGEERYVVRDVAKLPTLDAWKAVESARQLSRPTTLDYASSILESFRELHGDRVSGECPAIVGGLGRFDGRPVVLIGHQKGHDTDELIARRFGMPLPSGYRKAARLMRLAAKLGCPVVTLIDTPGAYPGVDAEQNGQAIAIAENLRLMSRLPVPIVSVITGEGGSGGALALGVGDRMLALSNSTYSVISPEGCAAILWRDAAQAPSAAEALRLTAREQLRLGVVDGVLEEPEGGAHSDPVGTAERVRVALLDALDELRTRDTDRLLSERHARIRRYGVAA